MIQGEAPGLVQEFVHELAVEALHDGIVEQLAGTDELQLDTADVRPDVSGVAHELRPLSTTTFSGSLSRAEVRLRTAATRLQPIEVIPSCLYTVRPLLFRTCDSSQRKNSIPRRRKEP